MDNTYNPSLLLNLLLGFSGSRYWEWIEAFGSAAAIIATPASELEQLAPEPKQQLQRYQKQNKNSALARQAKLVMTQVERYQAEIIDHDNNRYPPLLKQIYRPPPLLFVKGNVDVLSMPQIAIVGSRHATKIGLQNSYNFAAFLAGHGFSITSGLAIGIDGAAHKGAIAVAGKSIGVMATGIDSIYPRQHRSLADDIVATGGVLVTEFSPGVGVRPRHFPQRNRIISGLSAGVLVVEAAEKSGSLITARYALEQSRDVFAIPGSIHNPQSKGTHLLIKKGAYLVENASDIVEQLSSFLCTYIDNTDIGSADINSISTQLPFSESLPTLSTSECTLSIEEKEHLDGKRKPLIKRNVHLTPKKEPSAKRKKIAVGKEEILAEEREPCSQQESLLLEHIGFEPSNIDQLAARTALSAAEISVLLISLELKEYINVSEWGYERRVL
jgi:DNA processing protein